MSIRQDSSVVEPGPIPGAELLRRYEQFLPLIPTAAYLCDADGLILGFNERAVELWGQRPQIGDPDQRFCGSFRIYRANGEPMTHAATPMAEVLATGRPARNLEAGIGRPDGSRVFAQVNIEPLTDSDGRLVGALNCFVDITARRRAEEEARRSREELEDLFQNAAVAIHWIGTDGIILQANQAELDLLGYRTEEYVGHNIAEFHVDRAVIDGIMQRLQNGEPLKAAEARLRRKDGTICHVLISSNAQLRDGEFFRTRCFTIDITERKIIEERLALAKEAGGVGTFDRNFVDDRAYVSPTYWDLFGVPANAFAPTYEGWLSRVHPEDRERVLADLERAFDAGKYQTEYRVTWPNGEIHWLHTRGFAERGPAGERRRLVGAMVDITERKRAEEDLRQRGTELSLVADAVPALIGYVDAERRYRFVNRSYEQRFGRSRGEIEGMHVRELLGSAAYDLLCSRIDMALAGCEVHFEARLPSETGAFDVEVTYLPRFAADGRVLGFYAFVHDVTERRRAEASLRARATELETVMETVPVAVWLTQDVNVTHIAGSRYASRLFRVRLGENLSLTPRAGEAASGWRYRKGGVDLPLDQAPLRRAARGETVSGEELDLVFDDGTSTPLLVNAAPILDAAGRPIGAVAAGMDISERKRTEERQQLIMAELDHRVRNTLASIRAMLEISVPQDRATREFVGVIAGRINAMAHAHGLLTESGWRGARLRGLVADELAPYVTAGTPRFDLSGPDVLLRPVAAVSMALTVHELTTNAVKYGALSVPQGRVLLSWSCEGAGAERMLRLNWVEAGGPPVEPPTRRGFGSRLIREALAHEFGAVVHVDYAATGLRFEASIRFDRIAIDDEGAGTGAAAVIPAEEEPSAMPAASRVLLVENDMLIALQMKRSLESAGLSVVGPAARLDEALRYAMDIRFDCAVLDVNLGGDLVFPLADLLADRGIPFLFLTGYETGMVVPARLADVPALQKPVSDAALMAALRRLTRMAAAGHRPVAGAG